MDVKVISQRASLADCSGINTLPSLGLIILPLLIHISGSSFLGLTTRNTLSIGFLARPAQSSFHLYPQEMGDPSKPNTWIKDVHDLPNTVSLVGIIYVLYLVGQVVVNSMTHFQKLKDTCRVSLIDIPPYIESSSKDITQT